MLNKTVILVLGLFIHSFIHAQTFTPKVLSSAGGFFSKSVGSLSFTIGEVSTRTLKKDSSILTQGFQQGTSGPGSSILSVAYSSTLIHLYPNPASTDVEIQIDAPEGSKIEISIFNANGQHLGYFPQAEFSGNAFYTTNKISELADGVYFAYVHITNPFGISTYYNKSFIIQN